ncbi:MAG: hypothetical protein AAF560_33850 [Acidobacteriota bacterium]
MLGSLLAASGAVAQEDPRQKAYREIALAESAWQQAQRLRSHADFAEANSRDAELASQLERAQGLLKAAKGGLERADQRQSTTGFNDAAVLAKRVTRQLESYEARLRELWDEFAVFEQQPLLHH